jgi:hypothetical protein
MKKFLATLCLLTLVATPALALEDPTVEDRGPADVVVLFEFAPTEFNGAGECVNAWSPAADLLSIACENLAVNQIVWPVDAQVTALRTVLMLAGSVGYECDFQIEVGATGVAKGTKQDNATETTVGTVSSTTQALTLEAGDLVGVVNTDGSGQACAGAIDPIYLVQLIGRWVNSE